MKKTEALADILREINPYIDLRIANCCVEQENVAELFGTYSIVCEAFDKAENKAMLVNTILEKTKETIVVSACGMA
ncbi:ThiF family adenylyltransferase, partial [Acinetobacter sp. 163]|nr:ThiF family adenylyltransferase [Acinetobacter sp. 163]